ncbi:hypothetical protein AAG906_019884 [Vitis piasezkii]
MVRVDSCSDWIKEAGLSFSQYIGVNYQEVGDAIHGVYPCCLFKLPEFMCPESFHERFTLRILHWLFQYVPDWPLIQDGVLAYSGKVDSILVETEMPTELESFKEIWYNFSFDEDAAVIMGSGLLKAWADDEYCILMFSLHKFSN